MPAITTEPLVKIKEFNDYFKNEPMFQPKKDAEILVLIAKLDTILQKSEYTSPTPNFERDAEKVIDEITQLWQKSKKSESLQSFLQQKPEIASFYPYACARLGLNTPAQQTEADMNSLLAKLTQFNQIVTLATQLQDDLLLTNHKYMAHQMALLYQSLSSGGPNLSQFKPKIEKRFDELKSFTSASNAPVLNDDLKEWIRGLTGEIKSEVLSLNKGVSGAHLGAFDYAQEQATELEALEAIYASDFTKISDTELSIKITTNTDKENEDEDYTITLLVKFTEKYPEEIPEIQLQEESENIIEHEELLKQCKDIAQESVGTPMVFNIVSHIIDFLHSLKHQQKNQKNQEEIKKKEEAEAKVAEKFIGTPVTIDSFLQWKKKFDLEMREVNLEKIKEREMKRKKMSGRELFEVNKELVSSDVTFGTDLDDGVVVDVDAFEDVGDDLDELELESESED